MSLSRKDVLSHSLDNYRLVSLALISLPVAHAALKSPLTHGEIGKLSGLGGFDTAARFQLCGSLASS